MLDPFYLIIDNIPLLEQLAPLGIKLVQLRIKNTNKATLRESIRCAKDICKRYHCQLIINDYWQLALEEGCDFIHLGQEDLTKCELKTLSQSNIRLGVSTHSKAELDRALSLQNLGLNLNYVALGPIYPTKLKKMDWAPQGLTKLASWKEIVGKLPLVAIGGFTPERAALALQAGADSVAVVTDISLHSNPPARAIEWIKRTESWRKL